MILPQAKAPDYQGLAALQDAKATDVSLSDAELRNGEAKTGISRLAVAETAFT